METLNQESALRLASEAAVVEEYCRQRTAEYRELLLRSSHVIEALSYLLVLKEEHGR